MAKQHPLDLPSASASTASTTTETSKGTTASTNTKSRRPFGMIRRLSVKTKKGFNRLRTAINSNAGGDDPAKRKLLRKQSKHQLSQQHKFHTAGGVYMDLHPRSSQRTPTTEAAASAQDIIDEESSWVEDDDSIEATPAATSATGSSSIIDSIQPVLDDCSDRRAASMPRLKMADVDSTNSDDVSDDEEDDDDDDIEGDDDEEEEVKLIQRASKLCTGAVTSLGRTSPDTDNTDAAALSLAADKKTKPLSSIKTESTCSTTECCEGGKVIDENEEEEEDAPLVDRDHHHQQDDDKSEDTDSFSVSFVPSRRSSLSSIVSNFSSFTGTSQRNLFAVDTVGLTDDSSTATNWRTSGGIDHHRGSPVVARRSHKRQELIDPKHPHLTFGEDEILSKIMARSRRLPKHVGTYPGLHVLINNERVKRQVAPLYRMAELDTMAREHAQMMAEDPEHRNRQHPSQRFLERVVLKTLQEEHDYTVHRIASNAWTCGASDIASTHKELMKHSESDRNNIIDRRHTRFGFGTYQSPDTGKLHVCQLFID
mmetsp:Transcript_41898/g.100633  ORF Transcript_41898/g.100633 Transcript_41898/m.100633 type:complete len:539 (+) Transcript_41898:450-2066(+)